MSQYTLIQRIYSTVKNDLREIYNHCWFSYMYSLCNLIYRLTLVFRKCLYKMEIYQFTVSIATVNALMRSVRTARTASLQITDFILVTKYYNINSISRVKRLARMSRKFPFGSLYTCKYLLAYFTFTCKG